MIIEDKRVEKEDKILIVEDNESCFILIREYLRIIGADYIRARNSVEVTEILKTTNIDMALVDLRLSINENGVDIMKKIKFMHPDIPVIMQTADVSLEQREKCFLAGCDEYLTKPYTFDMFYNAIEKYTHAKSA